MNIEQYQEVIRSAIAGEISAKNFYLDVSLKIKDDNLKELFAGFAKEEQGHEDLLTGLLDKGKIIEGTFDGKSDYKVSETIPMPEVTDDMDLKAAIGLAMKNEQAAMEKYQALANNCTDSELAKVFSSLAAMETDHKFKLEESFVNVAYPEVW